MTDAHGEEIDGLLHRARSFEQKSQFEQALPLRHKAIELAAAQINDEPENYGLRTVTTTMAEELVKRASCYALAVLEKANAKDVAFKWMSVAETLTVDHGPMSTDERLRLRCRAVAHNNLGLFYHRIGKLDAAERHLVEAKETEAKLGDEAENPGGTFLNLAQVYVAQRNYAASKTICEQALEAVAPQVEGSPLLCQRETAEKMLAQLETQLAVALERLEDHRGAAEAYGRAWERTKHAHGAGDARVYDLAARRKRCLELADRLPVLRPAGAGRPSSARAPLRPSSARVIGGTRVSGYCGAGSCSSRLAGSATGLDKKKRPMSARVQPAGGGMASGGRGGAEAAEGKSGASTPGGAAAAKCLVPVPEGARVKRAPPGISKQMVSDNARGLDDIYGSLSDVHKKAFRDLQNYVKSPAVAAAQAAQATLEVQQAAAAVLEEEIKQGDEEVENFREEQETRRQSVFEEIAAAAEEREEERQRLAAEFETERASLPGRAHRHSGWGSLVDPEMHLEPTVMKGIETVAAPMPNELHSTGETAVTSAGTAVPSRRSVVVRPPTHPRSPSTTGLAASSRPQSAPGAGLQGSGRGPRPPQTAAPGSKRPSTASRGPSSRTTSMSLSAKGESPQRKKSVSPSLQRRSTTAVAASSSRRPTAASSRRPTAFGGHSPPKATGRRQKAIMLVTPSASPDASTIVPPTAEQEEEKRRVEAALRVQNFFRKVLAKGASRRASVLAASELAELQRKKIEGIRVQIREEEQQKALAQAEEVILSKEKELETRRQELVLFMRNKTTVVRQPSPEALADLMPAGARASTPEGSQARRRNKQEAMKRILELGSRLDTLQSTIVSRNEDAVAYLAKAKEERRQRRNRQATVLQQFARDAYSQRVVQDAAEVRRWALLTNFANERYRHAAARCIQRFFDRTIAKLRAAEIAERKRRAHEAKLNRAATVIQQHCQTLFWQRTQVVMSRRAMMRRIALCQALFRGALARKVARFFKAERDRLRAVQQANAACTLQFFWRKVTHQRKVEDAWKSTVADHMSRKPQYAANKIQATWKMYCVAVKGGLYQQWKEKLSMRRAKERREIEAKQLLERMLASSYKIQRCYRSHLARRQVAYRRRLILQKKIDYLIGETRNHAAFMLQRFHRIVMAKRAVKLRKAQLEEIRQLMAWRKRVELEEAKELAEYNLKVKQGTLLQSVGRAFLERQKWRRYRIQRVEEWDRHCNESAGLLQRQWRVFKQGTSPSRSPARESVLTPIEENQPTTEVEPPATVETAEEAVPYVAALPNMMIPLLSLKSLGKPAEPEQLTEQDEEPPREEFMTPPSNKISRKAQQEREEYHSPTAPTDEGTNESQDAASVRIQAAVRGWSARRVVTPRREQLRQMRVRVKHDEAAAIISRALRRNVETITAREERRLLALARRTEDQLYEREEKALFEEEERRASGSGSGETADPSL